jgi:hypothetical protein
MKTKRLCLRLYAYRENIKILHVSVTEITVQDVDVADLASASFGYFPHL